MFEAKKRFLFNIITNIMAVVVDLLIAIGLTPYLIRTLGVEVYGMIPLVISFIAYGNLVTMSISNAVTRFVAIDIGKNKFEKANLYFSSAISALVVICAALLVPVTVITFFFSKIFKVPVGVEIDACFLFFGVILATFILAISSPFIVSTFAKHRFDLHNYVLMASKILRVSTMLACFTYFMPSLGYFGLAYIVMAIFVGFCSVILTRRLTPELKYSVRNFNWHAILEMSVMSSWIAVNQVGALLYLSMGYVVINIFLGPQEVGRYGPVAQLLALLGALSLTITNVFTPIAFEYISKNNMSALAVQIQRATKFLGLMMGLPVGLMCGLSTPMLHRWLGDEFADLGPLVWLLIGPMIVNIASRPMFAVFRGMDKVRIPALITLSGGVVNVALSIALVCLTDLGIYAIALSLLVCLVSKNLLFTSVYTAIITKQPKTAFVKEFLSGILMALLVSLSALAIAKSYDLSTIPRLFSVSLLLGILYISICYFVVMNNDDKRLLWSLTYNIRLTNKKSEDF